MDKNELIKPIDYEDGTYHPSVQAMRKLVDNMKLTTTRQAIVPGRIARSDGFDVDQTIGQLEQRINELPEESPKRIQLKHSLSRTLSVSDLTEKLYLRFAENKNSMFNWLEAVQGALTKTKSDLLCPKTKVYRLPIELAQFIRLEDFSRRQITIQRNYL